MPFDLPEQVRAEIEAQSKLLESNRQPLETRLKLKLAELILPDRAELEARERADALEASGWENWLLTCFPFAFEEEFSADHRQFWRLWFALLLRIKRQQQLYAKHKIPQDAQSQKEFFILHDCYIEPESWVTLLKLARGLGKSATIEAAAVMRGAILGGGYCLYVCEAQDQAEEHISNCRGLIDNEESRLTEFYPRMRIDSEAKVSGIKTKDRTDLFITVNGWICRAKGLNAKLRGLRIGNRRPDHLCIDDIDSVNDSVAVSIKKLKQLTASVIPTQARRWATITFGQNLITENGVMSQIHFYKSDALSVRTDIGVSNAFVKFEQGIEYKTEISAEGQIRHIIQSCAFPTWGGFDIAAAQDSLNQTGIDTFLAEYMNSFAHQKTGKVFQEFNEKRHIITWSDFENLFGVRFIPEHWRVKSAADLGFSKESVSAWIFVACSAQNSAFPGRYFVYRAKTFTQDSIDDQAVALWESMLPDPSVGKKHFEAEQKFTNYPELLRLLKTKPRFASLKDNFKYNPASNEYEPLPSADASADDKALFYVRQAQKTYSGQVGQFVISHEKTGEQKTLAQKYGLPATKTKHFLNDSGVAEANHLLKGDYTEEHPFFEDTVQEADGQPTGYELGSPYLYFIVDDAQEIKATDDGGMKTLREHLSSQVWTQEKLTELGLTRTIPMKYLSDYGDAFRMFSADYLMPESTPKTVLERYHEALGNERVVEKGERISKERQQQIIDKRAEVRAKLRKELGIDEDDEE